MQSLDGVTMSIPGYVPLGIIGRGNHSVVIKVRKESTNEIFAVKKVQIFDMGTKQRNECLNEARILQSLPPGHSIISYLDSHLDKMNNELYLVLELAEEGDISNIIDQARRTNRRISEMDIWNYFAQICDALRTMHACRVMHRDIKPSNVFLTSNKRVIRVGDLGLARYFSSKTAETFSIVGTPFYMSPEAISNTGYDYKSDIWSLGCLLYELAALQSPFAQKNLNYYSLGNNIKTGTHPPLTSLHSKTLRDLVSAMLRVQPSERPTADSCLKVALYALRAFKENNLRALNAGLAGILPKLSQQPYLPPIASFGKVDMEDDPGTHGPSEDGSNHLEDDDLL